MSVSDFKINADVRRILNKHWISLKDLKFSVKKENSSKVLSEVKA